MASSAASEKRGKMANSLGFPGITALYERLSRDDEQQGESNSIINRNSILRISPIKTAFLDVFIIQTMDIPEETSNALAFKNC